MNQENFDKWCEVLTSGTIPQANGALVYVDEDGHLGMCCLGVGMKVMGEDPIIEQSMERGYNIRTDEEGEPVVTNSLPSMDFMAWLGLITQEQADNFVNEGVYYSDVEIGFHDFDVFVDEDTTDTTSILTTDWTTCAALNDGGFTFSEIVDCMRYFGIALEKRAEVSQP